jgi:hypothetical protein
MDWEESFPAHPGTRTAASVGGAARLGNCSDREAAGLREGRAVLVGKVVREAEEAAGDAEGLAAKR